MEVTLLGLIEAWLRENSIEHVVKRSGLYDNSGISVIIGFGWGLVIEKFDIEFSNRLNNEVLRMSIADPNTTFECMKDKISAIEKSTMDIILDSVKERKKGP